MRKRSAIQRALRLLMVPVLAMAFIPIESGFAEAKRIKIRSHGDSRSRPDSTPDEDRGFRVRLGSGSQSSAAKPGDDSAKTRGRSPEAAASAAQRARAVLEAERLASGATVMPAFAAQPLAGNPTTTYENGVTCIAGC